MKKCESCGVALDENVKFCQACGSPVVSEVATTIPANPTEPVVAASAPTSSKKPNNTMFIAIGAVVIVAALAYFLLNGTLGGNSAKNVAIDFCKAVGNFDGEKLIKTMYTEGLTKEEKDEAISMFDGYKEALGDYKFVSCKAGDIEDIKGDDLTDLKEDLEYEYDKEVNVTEAKRITLTLTIKMNDEESSSDQDVTVFKVGGKWYASFN